MSARWILLMVAVAACSPAAPDPGVEKARSYIKEVTGDDLRASGLRTTVRKAVHDGRHVRISGLVENRYAERVEGIRYTVQLLAPGSPPRLVDTVREEVDTTLDPGQGKTMRIEIENPIHASSGGALLFDVVATPVSVGGRAISPPEGR